MLVDRRCDPRGTLGANRVLSNEVGVYLVQASKSISRRNRDLRLSKAHDCRSNQNPKPTKQRPGKAAAHLRRTNGGGSCVAPKGSTIFPRRMERAHQPARSNQRATTLRQRPPSRVASDSLRPYEAVPFRILQGRRCRDGLRPCPNTSDRTSGPSMR